MPQFLETIDNSFATGFWLLDAVHYVSHNGTRQARRVCKARRGCPDLGAHQVCVRYGVSSLVHFCHFLQLSANLCTYAQVYNRMIL